jgi:hypothetical protein
MLAFQQALTLRLNLEQYTTLGMAFQQGIFLGLLFTTRSKYMYGLSAGHDCTLGFRSSRVTRFIVR